MLGCTVTHLENSMTAQEFEEWKVYMAYEPYNPLELQLASLLTMMSNYLGSKRKVDDFMVSSKINKSQKPLSGKELNNLIKGMF
jgi:hypothetical protein